MGNYFDPLGGYNHYDRGDRPSPYAAQSVHETPSMLMANLAQKQRELRLRVYENKQASYYNSRVDQGDSKSDYVHGLVPNYMPTIPPHIARKQEELKLRIAQKEQLKTKSYQVDETIFALQQDLARSQMTASGQRNGSF